MLFWVLAVAAVACGVLVFRLNSMARVTFALLGRRSSPSPGWLILLGLGYLGVVIILMMIIEMVIMAVFMIMYMMNPAGSDADVDGPQQDAARWRSRSARSSLSRPESCSSTGRARAGSAPPPDPTLHSARR